MNEAVRERYEYNITDERMRRAVTSSHSPNPSVILNAQGENQKKPHQHWISAVRNRS